MRVSNSRKIGLGVFLIVASFISSVVAANININTDGRVEFGQGLYQVGACDSLVDIRAESNGTNITQVIIDGLDIFSCPNTYLRIKIYGSGSTPLNLYQESTTAVNRLLLYINGQSGRLNGIDFLNSRGLVPNPYEDCDDPLNVTCKSDTYLDFDYFEGRYRAIFNFPMASSGSFSSFTIETSGEPFTEINSCDVAPTITKVSDGSFMDSVYIDNLDVPNCEDKYIRIRFYDSNSNLLNIYNENGVLVNRIQFYVNGQSDFLDGLDFLNSQGLIPNPYQDCSGGLNPTCKSDGFMSLDYFNGRYTVTFETPTAIFNNVARNDVDVADALQ